MQPAFIAQLRERRKGATGQRGVECVRTRAIGEE
jgi:hypothetical protein